MAFILVAVGLLSCSLVMTSTWHRQTSLLERRHEGGKKWEPSLGFYVRPQEKHSQSKSASIAQREAVRLNKLLSRTSPAHQKRFMKAFDKEAKGASAQARLEEQKVAAMLAAQQNAQKKRMHMLQQARQIPNHYKHSWIKSPNFNLKGYWPLIGKVCTSLSTVWDACSRLAYSLDR